MSPSNSRRLALICAVILVLALTPGLGWACACGCGVFDVGSSSLFPSLPSGSGGTVYFEYDFMDQNQNWHAASSAPAANNDDKNIRSNFFTLGALYMFNHSWGVMAELPYTDRHFKTTTDDGSIQSFDHSDIGDVRVEGMYTGFSEDMSTAVTFGLKVPSGNYDYPNFDRDTEIGSGSTDALLGGYHLGSLALQNFPLNWFVQGRWQLPFLSRDHYHPGNEFDGALGITHSFGALGFLSDIAPVLQLLASDRTRDRGSAADPEDSGYDRVLIAPGIVTAVKMVKLYVDAEVPIFANVNGNQLIAPVLLKTILSYSF
jgi:hypothetical protein